MISTITLDTYKQKISSGDAFNLSDSFNGRVGDEQVPLVVHFKERGLAHRFEDGLVPFLTGFVGSLDENDQVTAETGEAVSYVGTSDDIVGLGRVKMNLPGTMFPQEGFFYGFLGLQNADGKRVTTFSVWFHVYNGNPDMFVNKEPFRSELQKLLDSVEQLIDKTNGTIQAKLIEWQDQINALITNGNANLDTYNQRLKLAQEQLDGLESQIKAGKIPTQADLDAIISYVNKSISNMNSDAFGVHHMDYATVSTTVSPTSMPASSYEFAHIAKQGADATLIVMVNLASETDPEPVMLDDQLVNQAISNAKAAGVKITMLKPHLGVDWSDGFDRANYDPSDKDLFFSNWTKILIHYADLCATNDIPLLCIQCEQNLLTVNSNLSYWRKLTDAIRQDHADLLLTTATNSIFFDDDQTAIFDTVDLIGVNVYPNFTYKVDDGTLTIADIQGAYYDNERSMNYMQRIDSLAYKFQKKVYITEAGIMPQDDGLIHLQSDHPDAFPRDYHAQALGMSLFFEELLSNKNICGFAWWHTNKPFDYFNDEETTESEQTMIDYLKKVK
ncbi:hypothetical protein ACA614_13425 [Lactiplantibacillus plantarum]|uniref:glycoside hydrolase family 113 n=1 Tax=Lactiplantibacillus plantarum TaxID=1590 RepID=UPI003C1763BA